MEGGFITRCVVTDKEKRPLRDTEKFKKNNNNNNNKRKPCHVTPLFFFVVVVVCSLLYGKTTYPIKKKRE